jgi:hypothetical protein
MTEMLEPRDLHLGSPDAPELLLPLMACLVPLHEINSAIASCRELHGPAITAEATDYLEGALIDDNMARLGMTPIASVEWGPTCCGDEEYAASIYTLPVPERGKLVVVRWWDGAPHWWSHGASAAKIEVVIEALERRVGRTCNRVVGQLPG